MKKSPDNKPKYKKNFRKEIKINYTHYEFMKKYNQGTINKNTFKVIMPFLNYFDIDKKDLKRENTEELEYEIQYDIADLLSIMMKNFTQNPLYDLRSGNNKITSSTISQYNNYIINDINNLPDYLKLFIKNNENFKYNYTLAKFIPILLDRLSLLFATISLYSNSNAGNVLTDLISEIDQWIDNYFTHASELNHYKNNTQIPILNFDSLNQFNAQNDLGYSIDNILKEGFQRFHRDKNSEFDSSMPIDLFKEIMNCNNEDVTEDEIRSTYTNFLNSIYASPELLKKQLDDYKSSEKLIDELQDNLNPVFFMKNKKNYIKFCINELNRIFFDYKRGITINNNIDNRNVARFIEKLNSCDADKFERTVIKSARELYSLKLEEINLKYELYKSVINKDPNNSLKPIREHLDSALGQTLLLILNKEYNFSNLTKQKIK